MVGPTYVETDTLLIKERERELKLHRERIHCTKKTIDNAVPSSYQQTKIRSNKLKHFETFERDLSNKVLLNKLLGIMNQDKSHSTQPSTRNYSVPLRSPGKNKIKQKEEMQRIFNENRFIVKRLTKQESELSCRNFEKHYQSHMQYSKRISKMNRLTSKQSNKTLLPPISIKQKSTDKTESRNEFQSSDKNETS